MKFDRASLELALKVDGVANAEFWRELFLLAGIPEGYYTSEGFISPMTDFIKAVDTLAKRNKKPVKDAFFLVINKKENTLLKLPSKFEVIFSKPRINYIIKYYQQKEISSMLEVL